MEPTIEPHLILPINKDKKFETFYHFIFIGMLIFLLQVSRCNVTHSVIIVLFNYKTVN